MRNRFQFVRPVARYMGALMLVLAGLLLIPVAVQQLYWYMGHNEVSPLCYILPAAIACMVGWIMRWWSRDEELTEKGGMLVCALAWVFLSAIAAIPFVMALGISYLDAYFETVSGFTTTGITMLSGIDDMPRSIIFWRAFIQWIGGLGILAFFLLVVRSGGSSRQLFHAEAHKIKMFAKSPSPSLVRTLEFLFGIYGLFTLIITIMLVMAGSSVYDAVVHSFTCLSTGGYSPYDASVGHYQEAGYAHYAAIEYILILGMLLGGMNFLVHFQIITGKLSALWDNMEVRLWWLIVGGATVFVWVDHSLNRGLSEIESSLRTTLFQVVSIVTTTGYATENIGGAFFPALSMQIFLILMVIGGCVGSTGGGIKVMRIGVLLKTLKRQVRRILLGKHATNPLLVDGEMIEEEEVQRIAALFFGWLLLLAVGAGITAILTPHLGPMRSASGMFSALGNIGPSYISVEETIELHPIVKLTYIVGMLAGRLEILPILMLFSRRTWR